MGCISLHYGIGGTVKDLSLGFVNNEISSINECFNQTFYASEIKDFDCFIHKASCRFINEIDNNIIAKVKKIFTY